MPADLSELFLSVYCLLFIANQRGDRGRGSARMRFKFSINKKMVSAAQIRADAVRVRGPPSGSLLKNYEIHQSTTPSCGNFKFFTILTFKQIVEIV